MRCLICQKWEALGGEELRCGQCVARMDKKPEHMHDFKAFRFHEGAKIAYFTCECGEQRMGLSDPLVSLDSETSTTV